jgi:ABC-type antimicrobial peptide transport system permease subunit
MSLIIKKEKIITAAIIMGLFGGLVGGPVFSLVFYYAHNT